MLTDVCPCLVHAIPPLLVRLPPLMAAEAQPQLQCSQWYAAQQLERPDQDGTLRPV